MLTTIFLIVAVSLVGSFLCSLFEAALYSIPPTRIEAMRRAGKFGAKKLAALRARVDQPIAAILTFNTITHTMGATWAGALVGETYGNYWVTWFSVAFTIAILFLTEIIPKTIGVVHASTLGPLSAWPIQGMIWLVWPLAWVSVKVTEKLTKRAEAAGPSEEEILVMADLAHKSGKVLPEEHSWIQNALRLDRVTAHNLLTPRPVVEWLPTSLTVAEASARKLLHSRLPLVEGDDLAQTRGVVHRRDIYDRLVRGENDTKLSALMKPVAFVPETLAGNALLKHFLREQRHLTMVVDEHGDVVGLVTLEDVIEHLLGQEIVDEYDEHADLQEAARRKARARLHRSE
jgi:CBS domain containing-hemolysin-like protein